MPREADRPVKIGQAARLSGLSESALRFYEREGLLTPLRTPKGTRLYGRHHLRRLRALKLLSDAGLALSEIRMLADERKRCTVGDEAATRVGSLLARQQAEIRAQIATLRKLDRALARARKLVSQCKGCGNRPNARDCPDCPVNRQLGENDLLDLVWE